MGHFSFIHFEIIKTKKDLLKKRPAKKDLLLKTPIVEGLLYSQVVTQYLGPKALWVCCFYISGKRLFLGTPSQSLSENPKLDFLVCLVTSMLPKNINIIYRWFSNCRVFNWVVWPKFVDYRRFKIFCLTKRGAQKISFTEKYVKFGHFFTVGKFSSGHYF